MNDEDIERVLKSAGPRERPPAEIERALRNSLRTEWRAVVADERRSRQRRTTFALAAGVLAAAIGIWFAVPQLTGQAEVIGSMTLAAGEVRARSGRFDSWRPVAAGQVLTVGQVLETGSAGRSALTLPGGVSARLDHDTRLTLASAGEIVLDRGALYIDAGPATSAATRLDVITQSGSVRHVGTQYEVRLTGSGVRLRVREGRVEWQSNAGGIEQSAAGQQLTIGDDGSVERQATPLDDESWGWIAAVTPAIDIEGLPLADFLSWVARELGREVTYASPGAATEAAAVVLHGSIAGLTPRQALEAVVATTRVHVVLADRRILVSSQEAASQSAD